MMARSRHGRDLKCIYPELLLAAPADSEVIAELAPDDDDDRPF
jgi:hypothetical protein